MKKCIACEKIYTTEDIENHYKRSPLCKSWENYIENGDVYASIINDMCEIIKETKEEEFKCVCGNFYETKGGYQKHLRTHKECMKKNYYNQLKNKEEKNKSESTSLNLINTYFDKELGKLGSNIFDNIIDKPVGSNNYEVQYPFPENTKNNFDIFHIIWNLYLSDKESIKNDMFENTLFDLKINYIILIFPEEYNLNIKDKSIKIDTLIYEKNSNIISKIEYKKYNECYDLMERYQKERKNILIICNSGYQRSIPFICKYLITRHQDEVPDLERAINICLSQLDKTNFMNIKNSTITNLKTLNLETDQNYIFPFF